jgi:hypothetical protein
MEIKEFKEALMLYGADLGSWPKELKEEARGLLDAGGTELEEINELIAEEKALESLLSERTFEEPNEFLATRIIARAEETGSREESRGILGGFFYDFFTPKAAIALALTLVIGFMVGYMGPKSTYDSFAADELTEESFVDLLMEGDIFE